MFNMFVLFFLSSFDVYASRCGNVPKETLSADFKIAAIRKVAFTCLVDEKGMFISDDNLRRIQQKGCILELELFKLKSGKVSDAYKISSGRYLVYENSDLCNTPIDSKISKTIESNVYECCKERVRGRMERMDSCNMKPQPKLLKEPTEAYIKCYDNEANWQFVEK